MDLSTHRAARFISCATSSLKHQTYDPAEAAQGRLLRLPPAAVWQMLPPKVGAMPSSRAVPATRIEIRCRPLYKRLLQRPRTYKSKQ